MYEDIIYTETGFRLRWRMKNANFLGDTQHFELTFGRKPKHWSPEQLISLYERALERSEERQKAISDTIYEAIEKIKPNEKGYVLLYTYDADGDITVHRLKEDREFGWGWSQDYLTFSKDKEERREEKINFLFENQLAFDLGEKLKWADRMRSNIHSHVMQAIREVVDRSLVERFKDTPFMKIPKMMTIDFGGTRFYVGLEESRYNSAWRKFEIIAKVEEENIKI